MNDEDILISLDKRLFAVEREYYADARLSEEKFQTINDKLEEKFGNMKNDFSLLKEDVSNLRKTLISFCLGITGSSIVFAFSVFEVIK